MATLADRFAADISLEYSLIDRMRVRGHIMNLQNVGMLGSFFQRFRAVDWIDQGDLQRITADFVAHVEHFAEKHHIPLLSAKTKEAHVEQAAPYLQAVADQVDGIYCIIKVQEETSSFVSYVPKEGPDKTRKIARGRRRVNHYYFFIKDRQFGVGNSLRISSYAPFTVTACFNGHHFVAQQLSNHGVACTMKDNLFLQVGDTKVFQRACQALTAAAIERWANRWVYRCIPLFSPAARQAGFHYQWYLDQVEYCHNLIFRSPDRLNALFGRLLDSGRAIGQPHVISRLFQRRLQAARTGGRIYRTRQEDYCLKAWHKKTSIKQYNKQGTVSEGSALRTETTAHDVREFGTNKALGNLPYLLRCLGHCNQRLLRWQDTIDQTTVSVGWVEKLGQPTVCANGRRVAGIHLHNPRLTRLMAAVLQFGHVIDGFRTADLVPYLQRRFGLSPDECTAARIRYDLYKLRAKGWVKKLDHSSRYVLTPTGVVQGTAMVKLMDCLNGTVAQSIALPPVSGRQTLLQKYYRRVRSAFRQLLNVIGLRSCKEEQPQE
jgi:hypothetical protein